MVDYLSLIISLIALAIAVVAVILSFTLKNSTGVAGATGPQGPPGPQGGGTGTLFATVATLQDGQTITNLDGTFYNTVGSTGQATLGTPGQQLRPGSFVTIVNNSFSTFSILSNFPDWGTGSGAPFVYNIPPFAYAQFIASDATTIENIYLQQQGSTN